MKKWRNSFAVLMMAGLCLAQTGDLVPPEVRLFVITGFLGGLTTFSTFSAEAVGLLQRQQFGWAFALIGTHLLGSLLMTLAGIAVVRQFVNY